MGTWSTSCSTSVKRASARFVRRAERRRRALGLCAAALFAGPWACAPADTEASEGARARDALAVVGTESDVAGLATALFAGAGKQVVISSYDFGTNAGLHATAFGDGAKLAFLPRGCLTTKADDAAKSVVYTFANCTYLRSIRVHGKLTLTYQAAGEGFDISLSSKDLRLGAATLSLEGTAKVRSEDAGLTIAVDWNVSGEGKRGSFRRHVARTISWSLGTACFDTNGTSEGELGDRTVSITVGPFRRCRSQCPEQKSELSIRDDGRSYKLLFDGTDTATLVAESGTRALTLACEP